MHIYFSGIGGTGIGPLALIAQQAGHTVSGSDRQHSSYIEHLNQHGITDIAIDQSGDHLAARHAVQPVDWLVYSTAVMIEQPDSPEFAFARNYDIHMSERGGLLTHILTEQGLSMIAVAGTHGKNNNKRHGRLAVSATWTTHFIFIWCKTSFSDMGHYEPGSHYFIYEADEFGRNFLEFHPELTIIVGVDYDHPDIYPTREVYEGAFQQFAKQSQRVVAWQDEHNKLRLDAGPAHVLLDRHDETINKLHFVGEVNRQNAWQVINTVHLLTALPIETLVSHMESFPGLSRRFERIAPNLYSDYAHTPPKIRGAIQTAHETAGEHVVVVYEGLHNTRQHFIRKELETLFDSVQNLYVVPSYLAREDPALPLLAPADIINLLSISAQAKAEPASLDMQLANVIQAHLDMGHLVLCLSAGGGNSLDEWLRQQQFSA